MAEEAVTSESEKESNVLRRCGVDGHNLGDPINNLSKHGSCVIQRAEKMWGDGHNLGDPINNLSKHGSCVSYDAIALSK
jgi:hypothetical protein